MKIKTANAIFRYLETLYDLNYNLITLCGTDIFYHICEQEQLVDKIIMDIPRLIPYGYDKSKSEYIIKNADGLMNFADDISFLSLDYNNMIKNFQTILGNIKKVRNKLEHKMHGAKINGASSRGTLVDYITYEIDEEEIDIFISDLIIITKQLNMLFSKIQKLIKEFAQDNHYNDYPCYRRIIRYDFINFNKIYENDLLPIFGSVLLPF